MIRTRHLGKGDEAVVTALAEAHPLVGDEDEGHGGQHADEQDVEQHHGEEVRRERVGVVAVPEDFGVTVGWW